LTKFPNVFFVGDALSARGITVSGAHGIYVSETLLREQRTWNMLSEEAKEMIEFGRSK